MAQENNSTNVRLTVDLVCGDMGAKGNHMKRLTTVISDELNDALKALAKEDGRTLDKYVSRLLEAHAKRKEAK